MATAKRVAREVPVDVVLTMSEHEASILRELLSELPVLRTDLDSIYATLADNSSGACCQVFKGVASFTDEFKKLINDK